MPGDPKDDDFSIIERLADAIRIEDEVHHNTEDRQRLVQDLYEGPRKCQCCVNWIHEKPVAVDNIPAVSEPEDFSHPLVVRHRVLPTAKKGVPRLEVHSIEIRHPEVRKILHKVFQGFDHIVPGVRYLVLWAPFRQFFWRWAKFEEAIEEQKSEVIKEILIQLRALVRTELAEAFAVSEELTSHGIINFKYLWTIFPPGELVYELDGTISGQFAVVTSLTPPEQDHDYRYTVDCLYTDWRAIHGFGSRPIRLTIKDFSGTRQIHLLRVVPAKYLPDFERKRQRCLERGRKFCNYKGLHYKAYCPAAYETGCNDPTTPEACEESTTRIMLDAEHHSRIGPMLGPLINIDKLRCFTRLISQAPAEQEPPGGHRPIQVQPDGIDGGPVSRDAMRRGVALPPPPVNHWIPEHPEGFRTERRIPSRPLPAPQYHSDESDSKAENIIGIKDTEKLTELQLLVCSSMLPGYDLKDKMWRTFDVERIHDIEANEEPFDSLVLPDGYKDLILSFVENQLKDGEMFDDVINGKGGGLVILLAGSPGVGKTLTAESVAEKINAPLVKVDLEPFLNDPANRAHPSSCGSEYGSDDDLEGTFERAARWNAVLLIDECDMYLEKRINNEAHAQRNKLVARFLRELEYYPSLLFLTTNREKVLDPAIYSRIHLNINYPALNATSRLAIWKMFLGREDAECTVTEDELKILSEIETNGRRIKNITKTARMMAKRKGSGISFDDLRHVMRITEGLTLRQASVYKEDEDDFWVPRKGN